MTALGLVLTTLALADLVSGGLAGEPRSWRGVVAGVGVAWLVCLSGGWWLVGDVSASSTVIVALAAGVAWPLSKLSKKGASSWGHPQWTLVAITAPIAIAVVLATPDPVPGSLDAWLAASPFASAQSVTSAEVVLFLGILLFLTAPANGIVRAVLTIAGTPWARSAERLRGGRLIGILERWLIFGLAIAGEPTAAALIVSAKSLLRFPELSKLSKDARNDRAAGGDEAPAEIDAVTEYFLLGSLLSWTLALAPALLFLPSR